MARDQSAITNWTQYLPARLAAMGLHMFSADRNLRSAASLGAGLYRIDRKHRKRARANIARCMPHLSDEEVDRIARESMQHFLQLAVEVLFTPRLMQLDTWAEHIELGDIGPALDLILSDQPTILVTGHYGNWEVLGYFLALLGIDLSAIARPIDNPLINDWLLDIREEKGMRIITKWGATEEMVDLMERGGTLAFIGDQNAGEKGVFVPYFNRLASAYKSIALLAIRFNAPIICGYARRRPDRFGFNVGTTDVIRPEDWADQRDPVYYVTARYSRALEQMVAEQPEQYLWIHRRWKSRPRHEKRGKDIPNGLRRQLLDLPWIEESDLAELSIPVVRGP